MLNTYWTYFSKFGENYKTTDLRNQNLNIRNMKEILRQYIAKFLQSSDKNIKVIEYYKMINYVQMNKDKNESRFLITNTTNLKQCTSLFKLLGKTTKLLP